MNRKSRYPPTPTRGPRLFVDSINMAFPMNRMATASVKHLIRIEGERAAKVTLADYLFSFLPKSDLLSLRRVSKLHERVIRPMKKHLFKTIAVSWPIHLDGFTNVEQMDSESGPEPELDPWAFENISENIKELYIFMDDDPFPLAVTSEERREYLEEEERKFEILLQMMTCLEKLCLTLPPPTDEAAAWPGHGRMHASGFTTRFVHITRDLLEKHYEQLPHLRVLKLSNLTISHVMYLRRDSGACFERGDGLVDQTFWLQVKHLVLIVAPWWGGFKGEDKVDPKLSFHHGGREKYTEHEIEGQRKDRYRQGVKVFNAWLRMFSNHLHELSFMWITEPECLRSSRRNNISFGLGSDPSEQVVAAGTRLDCPNPLLMDAIRETPGRGLGVLPVRLAIDPRKRRVSSKPPWFHNPLLKWRKLHTVVLSGVVVTSEDIKDMYERSARLSRVLVDLAWIDSEGGMKGQTIQESKWFAVHSQMLIPKIPETTATAINAAHDSPMSPRRMTTGGSRGGGGNMTARNDSTAQHHNSETSQLGNPEFGVKASEDHANDNDDGGVLVTDDENDAEQTLKKVVKRPRPRSRSFPF